MFSIFAKNNNMNSKILTLLLFLFQFFFGSCTSKVSYNSQITNYDYRRLDGCLIYNRDVDVIVFELFRAKERGLVFVDKALRIVKNPKNYPLQDKEIMKFIKAYKRLNLSYCRVDNEKIIRVISNGIDYIKIKKGYHDGLYLFEEHKQEYKYVGNDWYVKKM
jgi:putative lipoprotein